MQAIFNVTQANNCTLLFVLCTMQQCATSAEMLRRCDSLLDELNGVFEDDMAGCGLVEDEDGNVVYTQQTTYERAQEITGRKWAHALHELFEESYGDTSYEDAQAYCMLAIVQRNMFVQGLQ